MLQDCCMPHVTFILYVLSSEYNKECIQASVTLNNYIEYFIAHTYVEYSWTTNLTKIAKINQFEQILIISVQY